MDIYGTVSFPISCGTKGLLKYRVALIENVIDYRTRDGVRHHDVDIVIAPLSIDVQVGRTESFEAVAKSNCQAVTWNILRSNCNLDPV